MTVEGGRLLWSYQSAIAGVRDAARYLGRHPWRSVFRKAEALDLRWRDEEPGRRSVPATNAIDLCGTTRPAAPVYGAFENFSACLGSP